MVEEIVGEVFFYCVDYCDVVFVVYDICVVVGVVGGFEDDVEVL